MDVRYNVDPVHKLTEILAVECLKVYISLPENLQFPLYSKQKLCLQNIILCIKLWCYQSNVHSEWTYSYAAMYPCYAFTEYLTQGCIKTPPFQQHLQAEIHILDS